MKSNARRRNFGFGKKLEYAGAQALQDEASMSGGRYAWLDANLRRWRRFCDFALEKGISDARKIDREMIENYCSTLHDCAVSTQQNYISSINVVMSHLSGGAWESISPRDLVGRSRSVVRKVPINFSGDDVISVSKTLRASGHVRLSFVPIFSFYMGLRRREVALLDIRLALKQAKKDGFIDVRRGTKGGRGKCVERLIPANDIVVSALVDAVKDVTKETKNLIPRNQSYQQFSDEISRIVLPELKRHGISRLHDLRAAYACRRYRELTKVDPPCNVQKSSSVLAGSDEKARRVISHELGHGRTQIVSAYIGSKSRNTGGARDEA